MNFDISGSHSEGSEFLLFNLRTYCYQFCFVQEHDFCVYQIRILSIISSKILMNWKIFWSPRLNQGYAFQQRQT